MLYIAILTFCIFGILSNFLGDNLNTRNYFYSTSFCAQEKVFHAVVVIG